LIGQAARRRAEMMGASAYFECAGIACVKLSVMKKSILVATLVLLGVAGFGTASNAYDRRDESRNRDQPRENRDSDLRQLRAELYQLNIMFSRVDAHLRYGYGRQSRWEYSRLLRDRDRLNYELGRRPLDRLRIHAQMDRLRDQLRELEVGLRFHSRGFYYR
jgi:hypothetical protein